MKKLGAILICLFFVTLVVTRIYLPLKIKGESLVQERPQVPGALVEYQDPWALLPIKRDDPQAQKHLSALLSSPWLVKQPGVEVITKEMLQDWIDFTTFTAQVGAENHFSQEEITYYVFDTLNDMKAEIPFYLPKNYYSVLCIPDQPEKPFHIYRRLFLDNSALGVPFYLDICCFEMESEEDVLTWLREQLDEEALFEKRECAQGVSYIGRGEKRLDLTTHGFARAQGERGLFFHMIKREGKIFVACAEGPWETFSKHLSLFQAFY
ncbi:MAG: hypothetical protein ACKVOH_00800 [Chlamydiales bacterium]